MLMMRKPFSAVSQAPLDLPCGEGTVLVVDDEPIIRRMVQNILQHFGYRVLLAENGQHALDVLNTCTERLDVMILDLSMPIMNGDTALEHIREIRPELKVVVSSGLDEHNVMEKFGGSLVAGFIQKPYTVQVLVNTIKNLTSHSTRVAGFAA